MRKRLESGWANGKAPVGYVNVTREEKPVIEPDPEQFNIGIIIQNISFLIRSEGLLIHYGNSEEKVIYKIA
jgi:hypothetical protein